MEARITIEAMSEDMLALVARAVEQVGPIVTAVGPDNLTRRTPCPDFDVRGVVSHLIGGLRAFANVGEGNPMRFDVEPDLDNEDAGAEYQAAAQHLLRAFGQPGALDQTFPMPWGDATGYQLAGFELIELLTHGWDTARGIGVPAAYDDDLVAAALTGARQWVDDSVRTPQMFGPEVSVPADAPLVDQLAGFLGRRPDWTPN